MNNRDTLIIADSLFIFFNQKISEPFITNCTRSKLK